MPKCCSYCESEHHNISACPVDNDMDKLLDSATEPNFNNLSLKILKKIAALTGLKTSMPKVQLALTFKRTWMMRQKDSREEVDTLKKELTAIKTQHHGHNHEQTSEPDECPICMDSIGQVNRCVTKCGHKFCSTCFIKSAMRKNSCPMCRACLVEDEEYMRTASAVVEDDQMPMLMPLPIPMLEEHYMRNVTRRLPINRISRNTNSYHQQQEQQQHQEQPLEEISHIILDDENGGDGDTIMSSILDNLDNIFDGEVPRNYPDDNMYDDNYHNSDIVINDMYDEMPSLIEADEQENTPSNATNATNATTSAAAASLTPLTPGSSFVSQLDMDDTIREILLNLDNSYQGPLPSIIPNPNYDSSDQSTNHITISRPWNSSSSNSSSNDLESISSSIPYTMTSAITPAITPSTSSMMIRNRMTIGVTPIFQP